MISKSEVNQIYDQITTQAKYSIEVTLTIVGNLINAPKTETRSHLIGQEKDGIRKNLRRFIINRTRPVDF